MPRLVTRGNLALLVCKLLIIKELGAKCFRIIYIQAKSAIFGDMGHFSLYKYIYIYSLEIMYLIRAKMAQTGKTLSPLECRRPAPRVPSVRGSRS